MKVTQKVADYLGLDQFKSNVLALVEAKVTLTKLEVQEKIEMLLVQAILVLIKASLGLAALVMGSVCLGGLLNAWWESSWLGYAALTTFYTFLLGWVWWKESWWQTNILRWVQLLVDTHFQSNEK
ncbi:MAG: hypothetical protein ACK4LB_00265 [Spirosomataceae bacterium]